MLACFADANTPDRREAVVADRDIPRKPCCGGISAPVAPISTRDSGTECSLYGLYQRKRDVACGELRGERGANRERRKLPVLRRGRDAGGRTSIRGDQCRAGGCRGSAGCHRPLPAGLVDRVYGVREATLAETCQRLTYNSDGPYQATGTPKSLDHKFITEDVPTGLIPMSALGVAAGVRTPAIDALVEIARCMTGKDFAAEARTLERLGLNGMDAAQIQRVVEEGFA